MDGFPMSATNNKKLDLAQYQIKHIIIIHVFLNQQFFCCKSNYAIIIQMYKSKHHVPSFKTSDQIDLNRTGMKEFIITDIYINVYILD